MKGLVRLDDVKPEHHEWIWGDRIARQEIHFVAGKPDTGKGMSEEQRTMAFRPFFTTKQGGLGVGLVLVKRIMERFGGAVTLDSREGEGTTVRLSFMLVP